MAAAVHQLQGGTVRQSCSPGRRSLTPARRRRRENTTPAAPAKSRLAPAFDVHLLFRMVTADAPRNAARGRAAAPELVRSAAPAAARPRSLPPPPKALGPWRACRRADRLRPSTGDFREAEVAFRAHRDPPNEDASRGLGSVLWTRASSTRPCVITPRQSVWPWRAINWSRLGRVPRDSRRLAQRLSVFDVALGRDEFYERAWNERGAQPENLTFSAR